RWWRRWCSGHRFCWPRPGWPRRSEGRGRRWGPIYGQRTRRVPALLGRTSTQRGDQVPGVQLGGEIGRADQDTGRKPKQPGRLLLAEARVGQPEPAEPPHLALQAARLGVGGED